MTEHACELPPDGAAKLAGTPSCGGSGLAATGLFT
jgi:hypothetical protein